MGDQGLIGMLADCWPIAITAYFLGVLTAAFVLRVRSNGDGANGAAAKSVTTKAPDGAKLGAIEEELKKAKTLLEIKDAQDAEAAAELNSLDEAIKRANGRLKLILKALKRLGKTS